MSLHPTRRGLLVGGGALTLALTLPMRGRKALAQDAQFVPNAFIRIAPDNTVTLLSKHIEFGQGPWTGLATLVAEELDADWAQMRVEHAPADVTKYANSMFGAQGTGGSTAIANSYMQLREAGATARAMLVAAAAQKWDMKPESLNVANGIISASGKTATFGELTALAAEQTPPETLVLKKKSDFKYIGTDMPKIDTRSKIDGSAKFTMDVYRPGMRVAVLAHPPAFGATVKSFNADKSKAISGNVQVAEVPQGVAVIADNTYAALKARDALSVTWDDSQAETRDSAGIMTDFTKDIDKPGIEHHATGNAAQALSDVKGIDGVTYVDASFEFPMLAHAPMEPLDAVFEKTADGGVEVWMGSQIQTMDKPTIAAVLGLPPAKVKLNTMLSGGSFGRRAQPGAPFAAEAASVFKASGMENPIKFMWTRSDDIRGGFYRPIAVHKVRAAMSADGKILGWDHKVASQTIMKGTAFDSGAEVDATMVEGLNPYYEMPHHRLGVHQISLKIPALWWRSVGHTHTGYVMESVIDQLLEGAGIDAVEGRMALLKDPREKAVLQRVADIADWGRTPAAGRQLGVAVHKSFGTYVAQIAEVSIEGVKPVVHKVWAAVDCGQPINPNVIRAQMEGGIGFGIGALLFDEITIGKGGRVEQSNFHDYRSIRIHEMPDVEVAIIDSDVSPTGIGEPGVPPAAPAMANALRRLNGQPHYKLPIIGLHDPVGV